MAAITMDDFLNGCSQFRTTLSHASHKVVREWDPDVVCGWNTNGFDFETPAMETPEETVLGVGLMGLPLVSGCLSIGTGTNKCLDEGFDGPIPFDQPPGQMIIQKQPKPHQPARARAFGIHVYVVDKPDRSAQSGVRGAMGWVRRNW